MKDKLSALLDGDLGRDSTRPVLDSLKRTPELRARWDIYCLIGDVLRGDDTGGRDLTARVMADIREEPGLLVPEARRKSSRRSSMRKRLMPLAASVMGIAAVGYVAYTLYPQMDAASGVRGAVALSEQGGSNAAIEPLASAGPEGEEPHRKYVFVHQAVSGGGPIPGGVQHARTVSDMRGDLNP